LQTQADTGNNDNNSIIFNGIFLLFMYWSQQAVFIYRASTNTNRSNKKLSAQNGRKQREIDHEKWFIFKYEFINHVQTYKLQYRHNHIVLKSSDWRRTGHLKDTRVPIGNRMPRVNEKGGGVWRGWGHLLKTEH
jgi:hypothetical protein